VNRRTLPPFASVLCALVLSAGDASAQCTTPAELTQFLKSVKRATQCAGAGLVSTGVCPPIPPPACAGDALGDLLEVTLAGPPVAVGDPAAAKAQLSCQRAILRAANSYLGTRPLQIARGRRRADSNRVLPRLTTACQGVPVLDTGTGGVLPRLGHPCASAIDDPGGSMDATRAGRCLRAGLEAIANRVAPAPLAPNVILIETDDQNLPSAAHMPHVLEEIAERGVNFVNAFATTTVCAPSRASMLTGRYAFHHGVTDNFNAAARFGSTDNVARWFGEAGYRTALVGKFLNMTGVLGTTVPPHWHDWQALIEEGVEKNGDGFYNYAINDNGTLVAYGDRPEDYSTDVLAGRALDFVRANAKQPFLLVFTPFAPHAPTTPAPRHELLFLLLPLWRPPNWREPDVSLKPSWVKFMKTHAGSPDPTDANRIEQLRSLQSVDEGVAALSASLESLGLTDNTILVFTSDHGYHWGEHWWNSKFSAYDESLRVPLVVRYPRLRPEPGVQSELALNIDLAPTLAGLAGVATPPTVDGENLASVVAGTGTSARTDFLIESGAVFIVPRWKGVRSTTHKYVLLEANGINEELYDMQQDPYELNNLASDPQHATTLDALRQRLAELRPQ